MPNFKLQTEQGFIIRLIFIKKSEKIKFPYFILQCAGNNRTDEIKTVVNENATFDFDSDFDAYKMYIQSSETPFIYFYQNNIETAINTIPDISENLTIPLGLSAINADSYKISLKQADNIYFPIYLYDKELGNIQNLTENPEYKFSYNGGNTANRFEILFSEQTNIDENNNEFVIFPNPANTYVQVQSNNLIIESLELTDITGKVLLQRSNTNRMNISKLKKGIYFLTVKTERKTFTKKIIKQ